MKTGKLKRYGGFTIAMAFVFVLYAVSSAYADVLCVDADASGANDGTSWENAYTDLQDALNDAVSGDQIWVAAGTYYPTAWPNGGTDNRVKHFSLVNGVSVYGGFAGTEDPAGFDLDDRDFSLNETVLSGDIGTQGDDSDNCYHVFYHPDGTALDGTAILDGVTITDGYANDDNSHFHGGGMYNHGPSSPTLTNCNFTGNSATHSGGGMYNRYSSPTLTNCNFTDNSATYWAGGMFNYGSSSPTLTNCTFAGNSAASGGGMYNFGESDANFSSPTLTNCTFAGNSATVSGGGMYNRGSTTGFGYGYFCLPVLTNCTFAGNSATYYGGGIYNDSCSPMLTNCILWNNHTGGPGHEVYNDYSTPVFAYCDIEGSGGSTGWDSALGTDNGGNIDSDPLFIRNPGTNGVNDHGDLHLASQSPCIDIGDNGAVSGLATDMDGESRIADSSVVDMGADEFHDADGDSLPDYWETIHNVDDSVDDPDGDGLDNLAEIVSGTDPTRADSDGDGVVDGDEDYDGDSLSNKDEIDRGTQPNQKDSDGDGFNDLAEIFHGFDPASDGSIPIPFTIYVSIAATGDNTGMDWKNAFGDLQSALRVAASGDQIRVAAGTYYPTAWPNGGTDNRLKHFSLVNGVAVYGGFAGTEDPAGFDLDDRDFSLNETVLSGDIGTQGHDADNCYHVFYHPDRTALDGAVILDGVTITGGYANGDYPHNDGGGMYNQGSSSPTLINCTFAENSATYYGGGMYNWNSSPTLTNCNFTGNSTTYYNGGGMYNNYDSSPTLTNCNFTDNSAMDGGGMSNRSSSPTLTNCSFADNSAVLGGGMSNQGSSPTLTNCTFADNSTTDYEGGGMYNYDSSPTLTNCNFAGNSARLDGGAMYNWSSSPTLTNCILWNNQAEGSGHEVYSGNNSTPVFAYCDIEDSGSSTDWDSYLGIDNGGNIDSDPLFVRNPGTNGVDDHGDLHLQFGSPCIDTGYNDAIDTDGEDMDGEVRVFDGDNDGTATVDMGVDEYVVEEDNGSGNSGGGSGGCFISSVMPWS